MNEDLEEEEYLMIDRIMDMYPDEFFYQPMDFMKQL